MVVIEDSDVTVHAVLFHEDEYEQLIEARERMYGENAEDAELSHVVSLLALEEVSRQQKRDAEAQAMIDEAEESESSIRYSEEKPR